MDQNAHAQNREKRDLTANWWPNGQNRWKGSLWDVWKVGASPSL